MESQTCKPSYNNTAQCQKLAVGTSRHDLIFGLGEPIRTQGGALFFEAGAGERGPIEIVLDGRGRAAQLFCRGRSPS